MHRTVAEKILDITEICRTHRVKTLELFGLAAGEGFDPAMSDCLPRHGVRRDGGRTGVHLPVFGGG
jgi:hypothetical protein